MATEGHGITDQRKTTLGLVVRGLFIILPLLIIGAAVAKILQNCISAFF